jgi:hypothetical protein
MTGMRRELAVLAILARPPFVPATVRSVHDAIAQSAWRDVLPDRYELQAVHRALAGLEAREHASHDGELWQATDAGLQFVLDHIEGNPHVDPEAREKRGPVAWAECGPFSIDYDIQLTAATVNALAAWTASLPGPTVVQIAVDDRMTVVAHPGGKNAFDSDGSPGSAEYVLLAPLDPTGTARAAEIARPGASAKGNS